MKSRIRRTLASVVMLLGCALSLAQEVDGVKVVPPPAHTPPGSNATSDAPPMQQLPPGILDGSNGKTVHEAYGGVITNNTMTVAGQDFYRAFVFFWREKPQNERYAIAVHERPSARLGNQVWVQYGSRRVFQSVLSPQRAQINAIADRAAAVAYEAVIDLEVERMLFKDEDLAGDEF